MTETITQAPGTGVEGEPRTFYPSDWARAAAMLRRARHVKWDPSTPKPEACQDTVTALAGLMAAMFEGDAPAGAFDLDRFVESTMLAGGSEPLAEVAGDSEPAEDDQEEEEES